MIPGVLGGQGETIEARLFSKPVEFDGFKIAMVEAVQPFQG